MTTPEYHVEHLGRPGPTGGGVATTRVTPAELSRVFQAPWTGVSRVRLDAGAALPARDLTGSEALVFVLEGSGTATLLDGPHDLTHGMALTLFEGERLDVRAGAEGLELYLVEVRVEP